MLCNKEILIAVYIDAMDKEDTKYRDPIHFSTFDNLRVDEAFKQGYYCRYHDEDKDKWKTLRTMSAWEADNADSDLTYWFLKHHIRITGFNKLWR